MELAEVTDEPLTTNPRSPCSRRTLPGLALVFDTGHHSAWMTPCCTGHSHLCLPAQACVCPATSQMTKTPQALVP